MPTSAHRIGLALALLLLPTTAVAQTPIDHGLASYINKIKAVDNHAHPMLPVMPGQPADTDFDALPLDGIPPFPLPWRLQLANPEWAAMTHKLYGVRTRDTGTVWTNAVQAARAKKLAQMQDSFPAWVLDRAGIQVMVANRVAVGPGLLPPRFLWVPFDDALLFPLDIRHEAARNPDAASLYPKEAKLLHRYLRDLGLKAPPPTLDDYLRNVVVPTIRRQKTAGAIAVKFEAAYLRSLDFAPPDEASARNIYARYVAGGTPSHEEYANLENYLFRVIARTAGSLGMAVHLHVLELFGGYYSPRGSRPEQLESVFNDPTLRHTNFVMLHGGWPAVGETEAMMSKPNVYADFSMMDLILEPSELAGVLRHWLARWPNKVLFGTDSFDNGAGQGWDQVAYFSATSARRALAMALTGMMRDHEITRKRAMTLARMVLRENAIALYHLDLK